MADTEEALEAALLQYASRNGRPTKFQPDLISELLSRMHAGESVNKILQAEHMPDWTTLGRWVNRYPVFARAYKRAMAAQGMAAAQRVLETSNELVDDPDISANRAKAISYAQRGQQWIAERHCPELYAEQKRIQVNHTHNVAERLGRARHVIDVDPHQDDTSE